MLLRSLYTYQEQLIKSAFCTTIPQNVSGLQKALTILNSVFPDLVYTSEYTSASQKRMSSEQKT